MSVSFHFSLHCIFTLLKNYPIQKLKETIEKLFIPGYSATLVYNDMILQKLFRVYL